MPKVSQPMFAFNAGEVSPEFMGRPDTDKYGKGAATIENFIVHPEGGVHRRPATRFVKTVEDESVKSRLVPFTFSNSQTYMLEFSDSTIRIFADEAADLKEDIIVSANVTTDLNTEEMWNLLADQTHGYVDGQGPVHFTHTSGALPTTSPQVALDTDYYIRLPQSSTFDAATDCPIASPGVIDTTDAHGYTDQQGPFRLTTTGYNPVGMDSDTDYYINWIDATHYELSTSAGGGGVNVSAVGSGTCTLTPTGDYLRQKFRLATTPTGSPITISSVGSGTHRIQANPAGDPVGLQKEVATSYTESELFDLQFAQSADFLYIVHPDHRPAQLTRGADSFWHVHWALDSVAIIDGPYLDENADSTITMTASATTGYITMTAVGYTFDASTDIGRIMRYHVAGNAPGYVEIFEIFSSTVAWCRVKSDLFSTTTTADFSMGRWYPGSWPSVISFVEQRLVMCGDDDDPQTFRASVTNAYNSFRPDDLAAAPAVLDTSALAFTVGTGEINAFRWAVLSNRMLLGTVNALFVVRGSFDGDGITPTNLNMQRVSTVGAAAIVPAVISDQIAYVTANHQGLRAVTIDSDSDHIDSIDVTLIAKHIFGRTLTITDMAYQEDRHQVLWCVRSDGQLAAVTYVPEQQVFAWHRHIIGGNFGSGDAEDFLAAAVTIADDSITITGHGYVEDQGPFLLTTSAADLPAGLATGTNYYVSVIDADTFQLMLTPDSTAVTITDQGSGTHTITESGDAVVESVAVIPAMAGTHDQVWMTVKRTVNGSTARHIEFFEDEWLSGTDTDMMFMDSAGATYSSTATNTYSGLDHLEGETVQVLANGAVHPERVVSSGAITLDDTYTDIVAGLGYDSVLQTIPLDPPDPEGSSMGKVARTDHVVFRLYNTIGGEFGPELLPTRMDPIIMRDGADAMDTSVPAFTGDRKQAFPEGFQRDKRVYVRQRQPLPFNLLAMNILSSTGQR